jgi:hypothetical protein
MTSSINGTDTNLESNSCNECRLNKESSENISISKVSYHRDHIIHPVAHFCLHVIQQDHLNIAEFINNNLSKNERIVDFDYRLISRIECNEIILIISADFIERSASLYKKTRLILYCIIDIKRATVRTLEHNVYNEKKQHTVTEHVQTLQPRLSKTHVKRYSRRNIPITVGNDDMLSKESKSLPISYTLSYQ